MVQINEVQLATKLAHESTKDQLINDEWSDYYEESELYEVYQGVKTTKYKKDVQEIFNTWYAYYYESIMYCKE